MTVRRVSLQLSQSVSISEPGKVYQKEETTAHHQGEWSGLAVAQYVHRKMSYKCLCVWRESCSTLHVIAPLNNKSLRSNLTFHDGGSINPRQRSRICECCLASTPSCSNLVQRYGPSWICTTLIFVAAAIGTFVTYVAQKIQKKEEWHYDINLVTWSAGLFYGYVTIVPLCLYLILKYFSAPSGLVQLFCLYGYSLFVFIPALIFPQ